ncbi:MAG TPA: hypothetical protein VN841_09835 [Bryobacteraceae bacterium]|nr:hypothetical protein [Bryobacteraceae bacterium]
MKHTRRSALQIVASLLLPAILSSTLHASETIPWPDLPEKIGQGKLLSNLKADKEDREYTIVTKTGDAYRGRMLFFGPAGVSLTDPVRSVERERVAEIRFRHHASWGATFAPIRFAAELVGATATGYLPPVMWLVTPIVMGGAVAATPVVAVMEGGRLLAPAKVFKVKP